MKKNRDARSAREDRSLAAWLRFLPAKGSGAHFEGGTDHREPRKRLDTAFKGVQTTFIKGRSAPFRHVPCYNSIQ